MKLYPNGILVQELERPTNYITTVDYQGASAYSQYPLLGINNEECRNLSDEIFYPRDENGLYAVLEFITNMDFATRYINLCQKNKIPVRVLFIESEYTDEIWHDPIPQATFLGYEYCQIPFDSQIIADLDWYQPFHKFYPKLNRNGLFDSYEDVCEFKKTYDEAFENNEIGDDDPVAYICRISEVNWI